MMKYLLLLLLVTSIPISAQVQTNLGQQTSPDVIQQENGFKEEVLDKISDSFFKLLNNSRYTERDLTCDFQEVKLSVQAASFLWDDLREVNERLTTNIFQNFDKLMSFANYFNRKNDSLMLGSGVFTLKAFADLAVLDENGKAELDSESLRMLLDIVRNEPFNIQIMDGVLDLVDGIDKIVISKIDSGTDKGETQIEVKGKNNNNIVVPVARFVPEEYQDSKEMSYLDSLEIEDGASIVFIDQKVSQDIDRKKIEREYRRKKNIRRSEDLSHITNEEMAISIGKSKYLRDEKIMDIVKESKVASRTSLENIDSSTIKNIEEYLDSNSYSKEAPPIYFKSEGFKVGMNGFLSWIGELELDSGVILPSIKPGPYEYETKSFFVKGSYSFLSQSVAL